MDYYTLAAETKTYKVTDEALHEGLKLISVYARDATERTALEQIRLTLEVNLDTIYGPGWERHHEWYSAEERAQYLEYRRVHR